MEPSTIPFALVVDDDPNILNHASDILEEAGFRYHQADNGDDALVLLASEGANITLLFTDVEMPGQVNGFELARLVAQSWPDIEIVVASGRTVPIEGDMPDKATFIAKPFGAELVHAHLRKKLPDGKTPEPLKRSI